MDTRQAVHLRASPDETVTLFHRLPAIEATHRIGGSTSAERFGGRIRSRSFGGEVLPCRSLSVPCVRPEMWQLRVVVHRVGLDLRLARTQEQRAAT